MTASDRLRSPVVLEIDTEVQIRWIDCVNFHFEDRLMLYFYKYGIKNIVIDLEIPMISI